MTTHIDVNAVDKKIQSMRQIAEELKAMSHECPALNRNLVRLSASLKMLEMNFSDVTDLDD
jgi:predicted ester cyclase